MSKKILIFASGRGSNAEAIHEATVNGTIDGTVIGVICDHADAQVLERAKRWNVPATVLERKTSRPRRTSMQPFCLLPSPMRQTSSALRDICVSAGKSL